MDTALRLIAKRGAMRTPALAEELQLGEGAVDAMLAPAATDGRLVTCSVTVGDRQVIEYRCSAAGVQFRIHGGARLPAGAPQRVAPRPIVESSYGVPPQPIPTKPAAPATTSKGENTMSGLVDRITAAFKKHGPMTLARAARARRPRIPQHLLQPARDSRGTRAAGWRQAQHDLGPARPASDRRRRPSPTRRRARSTSAPARRHSTQGGGPLQCGVNAL
jgi:hypothetical protein